MNKKMILWIILGLIFLLVFNTIFFSLGGTEHPVSVWISYVFIHLSYLLLFATPILTRKSSRSDIFGISIASISSVYFFAAFVLGIVFIILQQESYKVTLVAQVILTGAYAIILTLILLANEYTASSLEQQEANLQYVKEGSARLKRLEKRATDKAVKKKLGQAYDLIHASPAKSDESVQHMEAEIFSFIALLESELEAGDQSMAALDRIIELAGARNHQLKIM